MAMAADENGIAAARECILNVVLDIYDWGPRHRRDMRGRWQRATVREGYAVVGSDGWVRLTADGEHLARAGSGEVSP